VTEQGGLIGGSPTRAAVTAERETIDQTDNIESNITSVAQNTSSAAEELTTAHDYQRKAGRRMVCLLMILIVVILVILLAVSADFSRSCWGLRADWSRYSPSELSRKSFYKSIFPGFELYHRLV
jgi:hypothetical protein